MDLRINGSYEAYIYVVLLQLSLLYLQRLDVNRRMRGDEREVPFNFYYLATRFIGTGLNWLSWFLAIYVGQQFGLASAVFF